MRPELQASPLDLGTGTDFDNPRMMQWNFGVTRKAFTSAGQLIAARAAREIQLGLKVYW